MEHANKYDTIMQMFIGKLIPHCFPAAKMLEVWPLKFNLVHMCLHQQNLIIGKKKSYWLLLNEENVNKWFWTIELEQLH